MATEKSKSPKAAASRGKAKGTASVTPAATTEGEAPVQEGDFNKAWLAGFQASREGTKSKPPAEYGPEQQASWFEGYKAHANPNAEQPVADIQAGYRKNY